MNFWLYAGNDPRNLHAAESLDSVRTGLLNAGHVNDEYNPAHFNVVWGTRPIAKINNDLPTLVVECGYINGSGGTYHTNRNLFTSLNWNDIAGASSWAPKQCDSDRWDALGIDMQPWRYGSDKILVLGQRPYDVGLPETYDEVMQGVLDACHNTYSQATWRKHPMSSPRSVRLPTLKSALKRTDLALTYCSTAAVEAVLSGIPTIALHERCIAWDVCSHSIGGPLYRGPREQWAADLAYRMWTQDELRSGEAWETWQHGRNKEGLSV
jgi:hypothetical protein